MFLMTRLLKMYVCSYFAALVQWIYVEVIMQKSEFVLVYIMK